MIRVTDSQAVRIVGGSWTIRASFFSATFPHPLFSTSPAFLLITPLPIPYPYPSTLPTPYSLINYTLFSSLSVPSFSTLGTPPSPPFTCSASPSLHSKV